MTYTREDILAAIESNFPLGDRNEICALLDQYGTEPWERERERVQLAIVELSNGNEEKLLSLIQAAKVDYRDVLAWKEIGPLSETEGEKLEIKARAILDKGDEKL